ncbi:MAG: hypothetical protein ABI777_07725 [Betaproteobacteria bacterium]
MPHIDDLALRTVWLNNGISPFARPVAAITAFVTSLPARAANAFTGWDAGSPARAHDHWYGRPEWELRKQEERYAHATDLANLEGMERAFDRREGESMRYWERR